MCYSVRGYSLDQVLSQTLALLRVPHILLASEPAASSPHSLDQEEECLCEDLGLVPWTQCDVLSRRCPLDITRYLGRCRIWSAIAVRRL